ncbi:LysE family translocator [Alicyclobacillus sp. SO9]|uniref:LysE family translocator n=1 Tax=Alicyclobacillus sp. SO9 TaxID=2665646 RepID=UPI0018E8E8DC|nr:LysE family translocator [Alicyclobacillus sp. SO9]QQE79239.1 LysE family translocator [Alicyclobacillus sp. SO9]
MIGVFLYAIGIMYTPGPGNLLGLQAGLQHKLKQSVWYFLGVGSAMCFFFLLFGYTGQVVVKKVYLPYISLLGGTYILYLAVKIFRAQTDVNATSNAMVPDFKQGLLLTLLNPKAILATLPIAVIQFPSLGVTGIEILFMSLCLALLAVGAPTLYALVGEYLHRLVMNQRIMQIFNKAMAVLLFYVGLSILWEHVYLVLRGIKHY